jgi:hypothetical protein
MLQVTHLPDSFGNKLPLELAEDQEVLAAANGSTGQVVDTPVEAAIWARDPESHFKFREIIKDLAMGNLSIESVKAVRTYMALANMYAVMSLHEDAEFFLHKAYDMCVTSLSTGGFGLKSINVQGREIEIRGSSQTPPPKKSRWPWSRK